MYNQKITNDNKRQKYTKNTLNMLKYYNGIFIPLR